MDLARLHWAACRRGMLELDVLFERYIKQRYEQAPKEEQEAFEHLLSCNDQDLFNWLIKREPVDEPQFDAIVQKLLA